MIFDTDVIIWVLRGSGQAAKAVEAARERSISIVSYMELLQGCRDGRDAGVVKSFLSDFSFRMLPLTENIGHRAAIYMEEYRLRAGLCMGDALVAATATENNLVLFTGNHKHFKSIEGLGLKIFRHE